MGIDQRYYRDERLLIRMAVVLGVVAGILAFTLTQTLSDKKEQISSEEVWSFIQIQAPQQGIDPEFVYALAWAESSLNAKARNSVARGMMQLTKSAWIEVSDESYRNAWDWKVNVRVAIDYLSFCRDYLKRHDSFTYPLLAACYRYGPYYVKSKGFDLKQIKHPKNVIYQRIFSGNIRPVTPPI
jgi:soluble lytic murein transglycosylase-like protein